MPRLSHISNEFANYVRYSEQILYSGAIGRTKSAGFVLPRPVRTPGGSRRRQRLRRPRRRQNSRLRRHRTLPGRARARGPTGPSTAPPATASANGANRSASPWADEARCARETVAHGFGPASVTSFLEARIIAQRIVLWIEPQQSRCKRWARRAFSADVPKRESRGPCRRSVLQCMLVHSLFLQ